MRYLLMVLSAVVLAASPVGEAATDGPPAPRVFVKAVAPPIVGVPTQVVAIVEQGAEPVIGALFEFDDGSIAVEGAQCRLATAGRPVTLRHKHIFERAGQAQVRVYPISSGVRDCQSGRGLRSLGKGTVATLDVVAGRVLVPSVLGDAPIDAKCKATMRGLVWRFEGHKARARTDYCEAATTFPRIEGSPIRSQHPRAGSRVVPGTILRLRD